MRRRLRKLRAVLLSRLLSTTFLTGFLVAFAVGGTSTPASAAVIDDAVGPTIVGGSFATGEKPWIAALDHNGGFRCTATHIAPQWVLTAAHCVEENSGFSVRIGSLTRSSGGTVIDVAEVHRHPGFAWPDHDIALLRLSRSMNNTFVPLATQADVAAGQSARIYGWGSENPDWSGPLPENLKYADGTISDPACSSDVAPLLCTQTNGSVAGGDSGGPVFIASPSGQWVLGGDCAIGHKPAGSGWAAYTSVPVHRDWIRSIAGI
ncbi:MAG TPA: serine protease [Actinopolymorphaceae bacterium]